MTYGQASLALAYPDNPGSIDGSEQIFWLSLLFYTITMAKIDPNDTILQRTIQPLPPDILSRLKKENVLGDYYARPDYQQNDYVAWIIRAKLPETKKKRLNQMIDELQRGGVYMNMSHPTSRK